MCVWGVWSAKYIDLICFIYALELFLMERFIEPVRTRVIKRL